MSETITEAEGARSKIVGIGGGGARAIDAVVGAGVHGIECIAMDTDEHVLAANLADVKLRLDAPASSSSDSARAMLLPRLADAGVVVVVAGLGGDTGTHAAPIVGRIAKESGALTIGVASMPFRFEGRGPTRRALRGLQEFQEAVDSLIVLPRLCEPGEYESLPDLFRHYDRAIVEVVRGIASIVTPATSLMSIDVADLRALLAKGRRAMIGVGRATGESRGLNAARYATAPPLFDAVAMRRARAVAVHVTCDADLAVSELGDVAALVEGLMRKDASMMIGTALDATGRDEVQVAVVAALSTPPSGSGNP